MAKRKIIKPGTPVVSHGRAWVIVGHVFDFFYYAVEKEELAPAQVYIIRYIGGEDE